MGLVLHTNGDFQSILQLSVAMNMGFSAVLFYFGDPFMELHHRAKVIRSIWKNIETQIREADKSNGTADDATEALVSNWHLNEAERLLRRRVLPRWVFIALAISALVFSGISFWLLIDFTILANDEIVQPTWLPIGPRLAMIVLFTPIILSLLIPVLATISRRVQISQELDKASDHLSKYQISIVLK
ncbi:hypothetical protein PhaeoP18_03536 (plasmid) [Phaeobacter piscinae]|nr:hypothetical protein PhaeoP92_03713 [Phaeobacter inhibens]AUQ80347.1 hypothetical protein PhaeoP74_03714 [Phaeobacter inhibens]AUR17506.1 hypothetical protein PhaeoP70_03712 [Phaeobacter inhibens]AUR37754.1 hypothetical protein PhaeoP18_03536 [Phaeobacter piscinae]